SENYDSLVRGWLAWGDYDRDGDLDLLLASGSGTNAVTTIYRNDNASWTNVPALPGVYRGGSAGLPNFGRGTANWGDYDNNGSLDLLMTGTSDYFSTL